MVSMLSAVGFSKGNVSEIEDSLVAFALEKAELDIAADPKKNKYGDSYEFFIPVAENTGIVFRGMYDKKGKMRMTHLFPAHYGTHESMCHALAFSKRFDSDAFLAMCSDDMLGFMMFYVQNQHGLFSPNFTDDPNMEYRVRLSCLAEEGKIILPSKPVTIMEKVAAFDRKLFPDDDSVQLDSLDEKNEDIYSIVDTTFHPAGADNDCYSIVGRILEISEQVNCFTKEELYIFLVECNNVLMEVCLNKKSLMGTPAVGRRFKGDVWLQGKVEWE